MQPQERTGQGRLFNINVLEEDLRLSIWSWRWLSESQWVLLLPGTKSDFRYSYWEAHNHPWLRLQVIWHPLFASTHVYLQICTHVPHTHTHIHHILRNNKIWEKKKRICIWIIQISSSCDPNCDVYRFNALFWQTNPNTLYKRKSSKYGHGPVWNKIKLLLNIRVLFFSVCLNSLPFYFSFQLLSNLPPKTAVEINLLLCKNNWWWRKVFLIPGKFSYE